MIAVSTRGVGNGDQESAHDPGARPRAMSQGMNSKSCFSVSVPSVGAAAPGKTYTLELEKKNWDRTVGPVALRRGADSEPSHLRDKLRHLGVSTVVLYTKPMLA
jgi:hypothetical protein